MLIVLALAGDSTTTIFMKLQWVRERNRGLEGRGSAAVVAAKDGDVNPACQTGLLGAGAAEGWEARPARSEKSRKRASIYVEIRDVCGEGSIFSMRMADGTIRPAINAAGSRPGMLSRRRGTGGFRDPVSSP